MPANVPVVQKAKARPGGLYLLVDDFWCHVTSKPALLDASICVLLDGDSTRGHFHATYSAYWPGNPADSSASGYMVGCTDSPVVATLLERYTAMYLVLRVVDMPVPTLAEAEVRLPTLRTLRHAAKEVVDAITVV